MRTFIFGAGASIHAGYPLASALWPAIEEWWAHQSFPDADYCSGAIDSMNELFDMSSPFELVLTELDKRAASPRDLFEKACLPVMRGQVQMLVCRFFDFIRSRGDAALYRTFAAEVLAPEDVVITFNYDVSLDHELHRSRKWSPLDGYGFALASSPQHRSSCKLLKLHGSTNWIAQIFGGLRGSGAISLDEPSLGRRPVIPTAELDFLGAGIVDPQFVMGTGFVPSLIMPAADKKFYMDTSFGREWEDFWDLLWFQAQKSIAASDEVHIVGYSLPEYDLRARKLLLETARQDCTFSICCRADSSRLVGIFQQFGFRNTHSRREGSFEGWLHMQPGAFTLKAR